jgi:WD40 repeat protein
VDGKTIISGSDDKTIKLWDIKNGKILRSLEGHSGAVNSVVPTMDGKMIISGSDDKTEILWDIDTGKILRTLNGSNHAVHAVAITIDGRSIICGKENFSLDYWEIQTGQQRPGWSTGAATNRKSVFSLDGNFIVTQAIDNSLIIWDARTGSLLHSLVGHTNWVNDWVFSLDGKMVISSSRDNTVKFWDVQTGSLINTFVWTEKGTKKGYDFNRLIPAPDGKSIICGGQIITTILDLNSFQATQSYQWNLVGISRNCKILLSHYPKDSMLNFLTGETHTYQWKAPSWNLRSPVIVTDNMAAIGYQDNLIKIWDLEAEKENTVFANNAEILSLEISQDERYLVCGDRAGKVWIFEWIK